MCSVANIHKKEPYDVYIGRPSLWGNPFSHREGTLAKYKVANVEEALERYRAWIESNHFLKSKLWDLKGKRLGCFCKPKPCHGDILVSLVRKYCEET